MKPTDQPKSSNAHQLVLYKRWFLREGRSLVEVASMVDRHIRPHYKTLSPDVDIALEDAGDGTIIAIQRWANPQAFRKAFSGDHFKNWWHNYQPVLHRWDQLVVFHSEWETNVVPPAGTQNSTRPASP